MLFIGMTIFMVGCSPYHSKTKDMPEKRLIDYDHGEFENTTDMTDCNDVYHVKYVHIVL